MVLGQTNTTQDTDACYQVGAAPQRNTFLFFFLSRDDEALGVMMRGHERGGELGKKMYVLFGCFMWIRFGPTVKVGVGTYGGGGTCVDYDDANVNVNDDHGTGRRRSSSSRLLVSYGK